MADEDADNVITIDNFTSAMPPFDPSSGNSALFGLVDMGSNGIRFSISDLSPPRSRLLPCIYAERAGISLYDALHEDTPGSQPFVFSQKTISKVSTTLARFASICIQYNVSASNITVFATEATRTAKNKSALLSAIKAASGLSVQILSPAIESLFGALGARSAFKDVDGLFMDLGGGSVQMTYMNSNEDGYETGAARSARSMPYGAAKLSAAIEAMGEHDAAKDLKTAMKTAFEGMLAAHPTLRDQVDSGKGVKVFFCGGGFRGYGMMVMSTHSIQPYPIPSIAGFSVSGRVFQDTKKMLRANDADGKIFGMSKRRRSQFPAIVMVVEALLDAVPKVHEVVFCGGGNRDGTLFAKLPRETRESDPIPLLCASSSGGTTSTPSPALTNLLAAALPTPPCTPPVPEIFTPSLLLYLLSTTWANMGCSNSANSADALHNTISGTLGGHPGMTHQLRAVIALALCARWGEDLGPADKTLHKNLKELVGESAVFWCRYVGTVLRFLGRLIPAMPDEQTVKDVSLRAVASDELGKKGKRHGVLLHVKVDPRLRLGLDIEEELGIFKDVGKDVEWRAFAQVIE